MTSESKQKSHSLVYLNRPRTFKEVTENYLRIDDVLKAFQDFRKFKICFDSSVTFHQIFLMKIKAQET